MEKKTSLTENFSLRHPLADEDIRRLVGQSIVLPFPQNSLFEFSEGMKKSFAFRLREGVGTNH
jgi:hypothetical protein